MRSLATSVPHQDPCRLQRVQTSTLPCRPVALHLQPHRYPKNNIKVFNAVEGAAAAVGPAETGSPSRTVILAVDGGPDSEYAVHWALQQLHRPGDLYKLVHCVPGLQPGRLVAGPGGGLLRVPRIDPALVTEKALADVELKLKQKYEVQLETAGVSGSFHILAGPTTTDSKSSIGNKLCQTAKEEGAAAVVMASASRGGLQEALYGSVAAHLVHHCEVPVVVLHRPKDGSQKPQQAMKESEVAWTLSTTAGDIPEHTPAAAAAAEAVTSGQANRGTQHQGRNLVVAVADSEEGYAAAAWVIQHLWRSGDVLHLLHVVPALPSHMSYSLAPDGMMYSLPLPQLEEAQVEESQWRAMLLDRLGPFLQSNNVDFKIDVLTDYGSDPLLGIAATVVATAERLNAAVLILSGHSKGSVADWLLGSVGDYAAHHASVPVVVLHGSQFAVQT